MAGRFSVETVFKAVDKVTGPVTKMQNSMQKFTKGLNRGLRSVNRSVSKMGANLRRAGTVAITSLAVAGAIAIRTIDGLATSADELAKRTRRLNFPIEEFQEWQFVAEQSGIAISEFDKSIEKFTKSVGEAKAGTGTLVTILKKANPQLLRQIEAANGTAEAFDVYVDAMRNTEDQTVKTALATAAFGRTGAKFINITEQSSEAVAKLREEMRQNGLVTEQQAKSAEAYNDAVNSLKRTAISFLNDAILPMLPMLTEQIRLWRETAIANREVISDKLVAFIESIKTGIGALITALQFLGEHKGIILGIITVIGVLIGMLKIFTAVMTIVNLVMYANPIGLIIAGVAALILGFTILMLNIGKVVAWFRKMPLIFKLAFLPIYIFLEQLKAIRDVTSKIFSFFRGNNNINIDGEVTKTDGRSQVVSPQDRISRSFSERVDRSEVVIRDDTGRAEVVGGGGLGSGLQLAQSGAF